MLAAGKKAGAALKEGGQHEISGIVLKVVESNSMSSTENSGASGGGGAEVAGRGHDRDRDKERSTVQRLANIIECINYSIQRWK